ncbi:MAG: ABC transporter transmembrane domain-containing protein [Rhizobiaceae bacterium]|nr:ABC transporter transmembrane domain-containing protein [Rhizobiaceae bacterium]
MAENPQDNKRDRSLQPLSKLLPYISRYKAQVILAIFFLLLAAVTTLTLPMAVRRVIDHGFSDSNPELVNSYFTVLILIGLVLAVASSCRYYFVIWLGERIVADLRKDVFDNVTRLSATFFDTARSGEIVSRLTADTTQIKSAVGATASLALRNTLLGIGAVTMMIYTSPWLSMFVVGAIPLIILPIIMFGRRVRKRSRQAQDTLAEATAYASESIGAVSTMQSYTNERNVRSGFSKAVDFAFDAARLAIKTRAFLTGFAIFLILSSVVAVLWVGANNVLNGTMSPGTLSQFLLYAVFAAGSFGALSEVWGELSQAAGSAERLVELLNTQSEIVAPEKPTPLPENVKGEMAFENVEFRYPTREEYAALEDFSLTIKPGETVAIVGPSGAGKSTVFSMLLRFYDPQSGSVKLDDVPLTELDPETLRDQFAVVPQESVIFASTVAENIAYGRNNVDRETVINAAKAANAHDFVSNLPEGYDTQLGERGVTLSGGQRQRLAIARAILRDAPVLLLDEATSALDAESEKLVQDALDRLMHGRTTIIIAHRLATILKADRIIVMDKGRIMEEGTHKSLIAKKGIYAGLAKLQFDAA